MTRILLLHGWDWEKYPEFALEHQWQNRLELLAKLQEHYDVDYPNMPGFGRNDANRGGSWTLDDYAGWLSGEIAEQHYDAVIGYSFGCAVATHWQYVHRNPLVPLVLMSPAISRAYDRAPNKAFTAVADALKLLRLSGLVHRLRRLYLARVVKNPHVIHGSPFLKDTYSNIVSVDLSGELAELIDTGFAITCIFGSADTATPPEVLFSRVPAARALSLVIPGGSHDIGGTHPDELTKQVVGFLDNVEQPR
jgi:pimeloyl-ACP methyl ester carboxylesterase